MPETVPCTTPFSNGTEYEWFLENNCFRCKRYRNGKCAIYSRMEEARFVIERFPYAELLDYKGYAGKVCKKFTTEPQKKHPTQLDGQMMLDI